MNNFFQGWRKFVAGSISGALLVGSLLLFFPLISSLHIDSAILGGILGAFAGAWIASSFRERHLLWLVCLIYTAAIPLLIHDVITGCFSTDGAAYWIFIPLFSTVFGFSIGRMVRSVVPVSTWYSRLLSLGILVFVLIGGLAGTFLLFPQLYAFNHIIGYWPGPIYDESVLFTGRLILYRTITLTWIAIFWMIPHIRHSEPVIKAIFLMLVTSLVLHYSLSAQNGLISPKSHIQSTLNGSYQSEHFDLYFSETHYDPVEVAFLGMLHEFHFQELTDTLRIEWPEGERIESYLYGQEWQMQRLTGAKQVSFVPVWQRTPQMHIRKNAIDRTLRHEMVHVIAREFGNPLLNASWNIGLVEGLAVALSPASSARLTTDQLVVSNDALYSQEKIAELFSLTGFYRESGSVAYNVSGSFVATLLREFDVARFKTAYRHSSLEKGYGEVLPVAIAHWHNRVLQMEVTPEEEELAAALFAIPSLLDQDCPRKQSDEAATRDVFRRAMAEQDSVRAMEYLEASLCHNPDWASGWMHWIRHKLEAGDAEFVLLERDRFPDHPLIAVLVADALMAVGRSEEALGFKERAIKDDDLPIQARRAWRLRENPELWNLRTDLLYQPSLHPKRFLEIAGSFDDASLKHELLISFFAEWFRRNPLPVSGWKDTLFASVVPHESREMVSMLQEIPGELRDFTSMLQEIPACPPTDTHFETYRNLIYLSGVTPFIDSGRFENCIADWRPVQQERWNEALRFADFASDRYAGSSFFSDGS